MTPSSFQKSSQTKNHNATGENLITRDSGIISAAESGHESETNTIKNFLSAGEDFEEQQQKWDITRPTSADIRLETFIYVEGKGESAFLLSIPLNK